MHRSSAFVVVDVQQALCFGEYAAYDAERVIDRINVVSRKAREAGAPVVFVQHEEASAPLLHGSAGWKLASGLVTRDGDIHVRKSASDSFHETGLAAILEHYAVKHLIVAGLQSEFCVDSTVRRALALGFPVTLVSDAHSTMDSSVLTAAQIAAHHNLTLANLGSYGPRVKLLRAEEVGFARQ